MSDSSPADDSLLDVERYIEEVESYLQKDGSGGAVASGGASSSGGGKSVQQPTTVTIAGREYSTGAYAPQITQQPQSQQQQYQQIHRPAAAVPRQQQQPQPAPRAAPPAQQRPTATPSHSVHSDTLSSTSSYHSTPASSRGAPTPRDFYSHAAATDAYADRSGFSTPSSVSSASAASGVAGSGRYTDRSYDAAADRRSLSSVSSLAHSSPTRARASVPASDYSPRSVAASSTAFRDAPTARNASATDSAEEKQRIVDQLLRQRRQAQVTGRALATNPASIAAARGAPPEVPAPVSTPVVPHSSALGPAEREQMVERLLRERRQQKEMEFEAQEDQGHHHHPAAAAAAAAVGSRPAAAAYASSPQRSRPASAASSARRGNMRHSPTPPPRPVAEAHLAPQPARPAAASSYHDPSGGGPVDYEDSFHSPQDHPSFNGDASYLSAAAADDSHLDSSSLPPRSGATSPLDARFRPGHEAQTIFDAADYFNEDGTSIRHDSVYEDREEEAQQQQHYEQQDQSTEEAARWAAPSQTHPHDEYAHNDSVAEYSQAEEYLSPSAAGRAQRFGTRDNAARAPATRRNVPVSARRAQSRSPPGRQRQQQRVVGAGTGASGQPKQQQQQQRGRSAVRPGSAAGTRSSSLAARPHTLRPSASTSSTSTSHVRGIPSSSSGRYSRASLVASIERERAEVCTFAPQLVSKPLSSDAPTAGLSLEDRLALWQRRQNQSLNRKLEQRREYEEEKLAECTFAPNINQASKAVAQSQPRAREPVAERLHHEADQRALLREKARRMNEEEMLSSLPFAPQVSASSLARVPPAARAPLYQRVADLQKRKNEKLHLALLAAREAELGGCPPSAAFKPLVNPVSEKLARAREEKERLARAGSAAEAQRAQDALDDPASLAAQQSASSRLGGEALVKDQLVSRIRARDAQATLDAAAFTFRPAVNPLSDKIVKQSPLFAGEEGRDFLARQERLQALSARAAAERAAAEAAQSNNTFKPNIGNADAVLAASRWRAAQAAAAQAAGVPVEQAATFLPPQHSAPAPSGSADAQAAERLSSLESRELNMLKNKLRSVHDAAAGMTFKPEISAVSRRLAEQRAESVAAAGGSAVESEARRMAAELLSSAADEQFRAVHTFKPTLSAASREMVERGLVAPHYNARDPRALSAAIREERAEKELKRAALARVNEIKELAECTFDPAVAVNAAAAVAAAEKESGAGSAHGGSVSSAVPKRTTPLGHVPRQSKQPVLVRGMNRFLELKALHKRQEAEAEERRRRVFLSDIYDYPVDAATGTPKLPTTTAGTPVAPMGAVGPAVVAGAPEGYTIPQPFRLSHDRTAAERAEATARAEQEARRREMAECSFKPTTSHAHNKSMIQQLLQDDDAVPNTGGFVDDY